MSPSLTVIKVGGSLYDLPDLAPRLGRWLAAECAGRVLLVPGGGPAADMVRDLDRRHHLGEEASHWLALRALSLNAHFLAALLSPARVLDDVEACQRAWQENLIPILDVFSFARADEKRVDHLPHSWAVTSDALAARVAVVARARELVLLKSMMIPPGVDWHEAGRLGWVDALFAEVLRAAPDLRVRAVNLRSEPAA